LEGAVGKLFHFPPGVLFEPMVTAALRLLSADGRGGSPT
jgi:hypothetical protein